MNTTILELLKRMPLFTGLSEETLAQIAAGTELCDIAKDEVLIQKGDHGNSLFIIRSGWVKIVTEGLENKELVLNQLGPGQIIGETLLVNRGPYSATAIALSPLQVLKLKYETFLAALQQNPSLALAFISKLSDRLRFANVYIEKAIEWSHYIAEGNYTPIQNQIQMTHNTIVDTGQTDEIRIGAFLSALFRMIKGVRRRQETLEHIILSLGVALSAERNLDRLLERILIEAKSICNADAGTLYLCTDDRYLDFAIMRTDSLNLALGGTTGKAISFASLPLYDEVTGEPNYQNMATCAALNKRTVSVPDIYNNEDFDFSGAKNFDKMHGYRTVSCVTAPLKNHSDQVIGVLQLINAQDPATNEIIPFDAHHQFVIESLASQAAISLNNQLLVEREQTLAKIERDVQIGRQIQLDFLPKTTDLPQPPGWEIATYFQAAREVAGDFFDIFPVQNKIGLVVADVCDKGVGAALFMSLSRSLIRAFAVQHRPLGWLDDMMTGDRPVAALNMDATKRRKLLSAGTSALLAIELTNNYIANTHGDMNMFATVFFGILDPATGTLTYINGGHPPAAIISASGELKARLPATGPAVGMLPDMAFDIQQTKLEPGDLLFAFSDGVTDARSPDKKFFKEQGMLPLISQPTDSAAALLARIETSLRTHIGTADQFDDITMLAVRRAPSFEP
ncbi:MAG: SpoIIE family protein phosphatase [Anaerolineaceae bacterium]|nr:SpoIIE family protein phosphatase [Anaerolineaceae bacterium]MCB9099667.1 SpoIIE family protein phosphatase [Anaerolineales bacterium]